MTEQSMSLQMDEPGPSDAAAEPEAPEQASGADDAPRPLHLIRAPEVLEEKVRPLFSSPSVRVVDARVVDSLTQIGLDYEAARAQARQLVDQAQAEADDIREAAREEGRSAGYEELLQELAKARRQYAQALDAAEHDMVEMAFRLAQRIIGEAVEIDPQRVRQMVAKVLRHARGKRDIVVYVAPQDLPVLEAASQEMAQQVDGVSVFFEADEAISRGSCVIETESGHVDGRIETQLDTLQRAITGGQP